MDIMNMPSFLNCNGKLIAQIIGGSTLYGLDTADSDVDYRGLFIARDKKYVAGFDVIESIVQTGETDACYYELGRYLKLLRKSNTQVLEILFAPTSSFVQHHLLFDVIRENKYRLIDSNVLKSSLKGYVFSEIKLATGERTGQLGGKRKLSLEKYGFSPKNFVQILRLCKVGIEFFKDGQYMVNVKEFDPSYHEFLMEIKTQPQNFTCDRLKHFVDVEFEKLVASIDSSNISYTFDTDLASDIILESRKI